MQASAKQISSTRKMAALAMLAAMAYALMWVSHLIPKVSGFLQFDLKDIPIIIGGFIFGPLASAAISLVVSLLEMITISVTGPIGLVMNVLASCSIACTASLVYRRWQRLAGAVAGLVAGVMVMTAIMLLWNWLITPLYMRVPREDVLNMLAPVFLPFNLLKGSVNAALTLLLYKPLVQGLRKTGLAPQREAQQAADSSGPKLNLGVTLAALFVVATCTLLVLLWQDVI